VALIDGGMRGEDVYRNEVEFTPGPEPTVAMALAAYRHAEATDAAVRSMALTTPAGAEGPTSAGCCSMINETARHAGHAATRASARRHDRRVTWRHGATSVGSPCRSWTRSGEPHRALGAQWQEKGFA
jgi:hypothetical protein